MFKDCQDNNIEDQLLSNTYKKNSVWKKIIIIAIICILIISITIILLLIFLTEDKGNEEKNEENENDNSIYINPISNYSYCIIWLHGLDNCPENFVDLFTKEINFTYRNNTKIILMRAKYMTMTYNNQNLTSWFDLFKFPINSTDTYNFEDAKKSSKSLKKIIDQEAKILGRYDKIYIGGHSQGACISLYTGYNIKELLGGVIVCSGILFPQGEITGDKNNLNVYLGHGDKDLAIPIEFHNETIKRIENYEGVKQFLYQGYGHAIYDIEKNDIEKFLNETMK